MARAAKAGLAKVGEPSLLRGVDAGRVNIQHGVTLDVGITSMAEDNYRTRVDLATIDNAYAPKVDDILVHPDGTFRLDRLHSDNGAVSQFVVLRHP